MIKSFLISFGISLVIFLAFGMIAQMNDKAYEDCVNAGKLSNELCYYYSHQ